MICKHRQFNLDPQKTQLSRFSNYTYARSNPEVVRELDVYFYIGKTQ